MDLRRNGERGRRGEWSRIVPLPIVERSSQGAAGAVQDAVESAGAGEIGPNGIAVSAGGPGRRMGRELTYVLADFHRERRRATGD